MAKKEFSFAELDKSLSKIEGFEKLMSFLKQQNGSQQVIIF
jgi:hypothetical protein